MTEQELAATVESLSPGEPAGTPKDFVEDYRDFLFCLFAGRDAALRDEYRHRLETRFRALHGECQPASALAVVAQQTSRVLLRVTARLDERLTEEERAREAVPTAPGSALSKEAALLLAERNKLATLLLDLQERQAKTAHLHNVNRRAGQTPKAGKGKPSGQGALAAGPSL